MYIPTFSTITVNNYVIMNEIVNDQWPLIGDLYTSCMADSSDLNDDTNAVLATMVLSNHY